MSGKGIPEPGLIYCAYRCVVEKKNTRVFLISGGLGATLPFLHDVHLQFLHLQLSPQVQVPPEREKRRNKNTGGVRRQSIPSSTAQAQHPVSSIPAALATSHIPRPASRTAAQCPTAGSGRILGWPGWAG